MSNTFTYVGRGVYSVAEAARLVHLEESRVRRWVGGYWYTLRGVRHWSPPLLGSVDEERREATSLSFADLIEVLYLEHFSDCGVPTRDLRRVAEIARTEIQTRHPFGSHRFRTDGRWILKHLETTRGGTSLLNLITDQLEPEPFLRRMLRGDLDLDGSQLVERWWPLTKRRDVVVDPLRRFGAPISASAGIPTDILFRTFRAERSYLRTAQWYGVSDRAVRDAVAFEKKLAA